MAREAQLDLACPFPLHLDRLANEFHVLPSVAIAILVGVLGIGLVDEEILLIDGEDREAKRDLVVVPDRDARQSRFARPDHREAGCVEMHDVAQRRHAMSPMGIVRQDRTARHRVAWRNCPVVRADIGDGIE